MAPSAKGKEKVIYSKDSGKRKRNIIEENDGVGKKRNRAVLQFIEDAAYQVDEDDSSDDDSMSDDDDFEEEELDDQAQDPFEHVKASNQPRTPKPEQMSEEDFDKMMENRYKPGSGFVAYDEDKYETKNLVDENPYFPSATDPIIWKVKCTYGRERHSAFCLMQKYLDLKYLGTKLQILSAFALDHVKGFIYIEADKQSFIYEACNGICSIYSTRAVLVPRGDISLLFAPRSKGSGISEGMWARVKNGKYRGDLAQVAAVNDERKKVTVKLIPRIDLRALAEKFGRGAKVNKNANPTPRLISAIELEEFRPLIQYRRDRDTNKVFEVLDGMMLKDGYLYKKVSVDSLSLWGVTPTEDELLKFEPSKVDECNDTEWLNQLYGERKKKSRPIICGKGSGKGEGSSSTIMESKFEVHDLVFFGRKEFGVVIGTEKDDTFKIIKDGSEGPVTVTLLQNELRSADFDKKLFTALDHNGYKISINDTVKVVDGPLKDREGIVKRIYRGIVFLYNETAEENNGYICLKTELCEKLESSVGLFTEKGGLGKSSFGDSSPKSPLSPQISHQEKDESHKFNNDDNAMYSIGQSLRIRVGPLKGYLCRVLAIRRSEVTVKLDSKHKIITVKSEHLSEVRDRNAGMSLGGDSDPVKPFEPKDQDGTGDWMAGAATATATEGGNWNSGGMSTERSSWTAFPASNVTAQAESSNPLEEVANKDDPWTAKPVTVGGSSWGAAPAAQGTTSQPEQGAGWGNQANSSQPEANNWNKSKTAEQGNDGWGSVKKTAEDTKPWGKAASDVGGQSGGWNKTTGITDGGSDLNKPVGGSSWGAAAVAQGTTSQPEQGPGWGKQTSSVQPEANSWNQAKTAEQGNSGWGSGKKTDEGTKPWGKAASDVGGQSGGWNKTTGITGGGSGLNDPSKPGGGSSSWSKPDGGGSSSTEREPTLGDWQTPQAERSSGFNKNSNAGLESNSNWNSQKTIQNNTSDWGDKSASKKMEGEGGGEIKGAGTSTWNSQSDLSSKLDGKAGDWSSKIVSKDGSSSGWGANKGAETSNGDGGGSSGWGKGNVSKEGSSSGWGANKGVETSNVDGGGSSGWGKGNVSKEGSSSGWGANQGAGTSNGDGGGASAWGKGAANAGGSGDTWGKKTTWNSESDNNRGGNQDQTNSYSGDTGGGGNWRGGGGGRRGADRGRFGGRGDSDRGGYRGRGRSDRGAFGGRFGSDGGGSGGRYGSGGWGKGEADAGGSKESWGGKKNDADGGSSGWGQSNKWGGAADGGGSGGSSGWGQANKGSETSNVDGGQSSGWGKGAATDAGGNKDWGGKKNDVNGGSSSGWGQNSKWGGGAADGGGSSGWGQGKGSETSNVDGGQSSGWGKGAADAGGSKDWGASKWAGAANASGGGDSWGKQDQNNSYGGDTGGGGNWRGGRGGRRGGGDRGGFGGRGDSDRGGYGGRGRSDNGSFGGRGGSDGGGFRGRGGSDRGGFRGGRGGFGDRGRGRSGGWSSQNDSGENKAW